MRLIDADKLTDVINRSYLTQSEKRLFNIKIRHAPTVEYPFYQEAYQTGYEEGMNERPQGEWNYIQADMCVCPFCGAMPHKLYKNFCPNCGAKMQKGGAE